VTFAALSRPMLALLKQFYRLSGNWGVAIILLTIFIRLVTFYPTYKTLVSAKKMQGLSGKIAELRKKHENDKQKLGVETMNMYKAHGVSPFGGCLPSLIQMPIWIALFSTLNYAVELYHSSFFWYITDLSAKDPYYLAPLLMGAVMFLQMRMSPAGTDPQQQKMMSVMMPVMFTGFSLFLPAGLSIYTLTSYFIGILQQLYVNRKYRHHVPALAKT
jgi:YidC/Oxa1 family membrane protein insertase